MYIWISFGHKLKRKKIEKRREQRLYMRTKLKEEKKKKLTGKNWFSMERKKRKTTFGDDFPMPK